MLNKDQLLQLGYEINPDPDQPGKFYWKNGNEGSDVSFDSEGLAMWAAEYAARGEHGNLHCCDSCGKVYTDSTLKPVKHLWERVDAGGTMPSGECSECGALCYPIEPPPEWETVMSYFGLDQSFCWTEDHIYDYTRQYLDCIQARERKAWQGRKAIEALAKIRAQPNCRHEVEAQLGEDMWAALSAEHPVTTENHLGQKAIKLLEDADCYLRDIRAENLDGSEPELGELLERLSDFWIEAKVVNGVSANNNN